MVNVTVTNPPPAQPALSLSAPGGAPHLQWNAPGFVLEHALQLNGPWTNLAPQPASPFLITPTNPESYFRLRWSVP